MVWAGYASIVVAIIWLLVKMYLAYHSAGGINMVVVYDGAVYPPILATVGLYLILPTFEINLALWMYVVLWVVMCAAAWGTIRLMEVVGDRPL